MTGFTAEELTGLLIATAGEDPEDVLDRVGQDWEEISILAGVYEGWAMPELPRSVDFLAGMQFGLVLAERLNQLEEIRS